MSEIAGKYEVCQKDVFLEHGDLVSTLEISPSQKLALRVAIANLDFLQCVAADLGCSVGELDQSRLIAWAKSQKV